jgi:hypothetical protein
MVLTQHIPFGADAALELLRQCQLPRHCMTAGESEDFLKIGALVSPVLALRTLKWEGLCHKMQQRRPCRQGCNSGAEQ